MVSVDLSETKTYGAGPGQTTVITESKGQLPRLDSCAVIQIKMKGQLTVSNLLGITTLYTVQ